MSELVGTDRCPADQLEALGSHAMGLAHDFNNCLTSVLGCLELLKCHVTSDKGHLLIREGLRSVERGKYLTGQLLSNTQPQTPGALDLNKVLSELQSLLVSSLGDVLFETHPASELWPVVANRNQLEMALMNLAFNARDAMPHGGRFTLVTRNEVLRGPLPVGVAAGDYVALIASDTGHGMSAEVRARAMEPFFSTKRATGGTGLGLSMVHDMMRQSGGLMRIDSAPGQGTSVTLLFASASPEARN